MYDPSIDDDLFNPPEETKEDPLRIDVEKNDFYKKSQDHTFDGICELCSVEHTISQEAYDTIKLDDKNAMTALLEALDSGILNIFPAAASGMMLEEVSHNAQRAPIAAFISSLLTTLDALSEGRFSDEYHINVLEGQIYQITRSLHMIDKDTDIRLGVEKKGGEPSLVDESILKNVDSFTDVIDFHREVMTRRRIQMIEEYLNHCDFYGRAPNMPLINEGRLNNEPVTEIFQRLSN